MADFNTIEKARACADAGGRVYACWYVEGQYALDMEVAR